MTVNRLADGRGRNGKEGAEGSQQTSTLALRAQQAIRIPRRARRLVNRKRVDDTIDLLRLKLDTFPRGLYQPVPGLPVRTARRAEGSQSRWAAIEPVVERLDVQTAMDIGASQGYFPIKLAQRGIAALAVDSEPTHFRTSMTAVRRNRLDNVAILGLEVRPDTVRLLPATDCTVFLSIWHHLVRHQGLDVATDLLRELWARTAKVMFFDTGEDEMPDWFGLPPMQPTPAAWLTNYLRETCTGARVEHLGRHAAFDAEGLPTDRNLFAVIREPG